MAAFAVLTPSHHAAYLVEHVFYRKEVDGVPMRARDKADPTDPTDPTTTTKTTHTTPTALLDGVQLVEQGEVARLEQPLIHRVPTGFPSPAHDWAEPPLTLEDLLIQHGHRAATFFVEMVGAALTDAGVFGGDILVVDRALPASYGAIVIIALDGELLARHYCPDAEALHLLPAHADFAPVSIRRLEIPARAQVWGVVTGVVRRLPFGHRRLHPV